ncbi:hypothetical protein VNO78_20162 [Psophocarpus tetragonolobus]|uniref:Peptidase A1 domain-containing protein n=1 Tax=Psophocarpus tetragonolobus TaxID=3891 RepID=A0AAN9S9W4_PSOTE
MTASVRLLFLYIFSLFISFPTAQTTFRPKALVLPVTKDVSTSIPQYVTQIKQRTPLVPVKLTVDLGGGYLWVNCEEGYVPSTSKPVHCPSAQCSLFGSNNCIGGNVCLYSVYNSVAHVALSTVYINADVVSINSTDGNNPGRIVSLPNFPFVCGTSMIQEGLAIGVTGMAGLGRSKVSFPSQFASAFSFPRKFAICLSSSPSTDGVIFFGDGPYNLGYLKADVSKALTFTPLVTNPVSSVPLSIIGEPSVEYFIGVKSIRISGKNVPLNTTLLSINRKGIGGTKISTVDPYTVMETSIYKSVSNAFIEAVRAPTVAPVAPFGTCFAFHDIGSTRMGPAVPVIDLVLKNGVVWSIIGANSMVQFNDVICLGFVDAGLDSLGYPPRTSIVIGAHQLENNLLQFDLATSRLGFRSLFLDHTNCANFNFTPSA